MPNWLFFLQEKKIPQTKRMCSECCSNISAADRSWLSQLCLLRDGLEKPAGTNPGAAQQTPREQRCCFQLRFITFAAAADWWSRWVRDMGHRQSPQAGGSAYLLVLFCCACLCPFFPRAEIFWQPDLPAMHQQEACGTKDEHT